MRLKRLSVVPEIWLRLKILSSKMSFSIAHLLSWLIASCELSAGASQAWAFAPEGARVKVKVKKAKRKVRKRTIDN